MFLWRDVRAGVVRAVTDRWGGVSAAPFAALNLADHVGDRPADVAANRARVATALGVDAEALLFPSQCHGSSVHVVDAPFSGPAPQADALVTTRADLALGVLVADCVPVLLSDSGAGVVAAVHVGRAGLTAGIVDRVFEVMDALGASAVEALVGPSVCARCYEVPEPLRDAVAAVSPVAAAVSWAGTPAVDVAAGVVDQLAERATLTWVPGCPREHPDLYSYRAERTTGRFAGVIVRSSRDGDPRSGEPAARSAPGASTASGAPRASDWSGTSGVPTASGASTASGAPRAPGRSGTSGAPAASGEPGLAPGAPGTPAGMGGG